MWQPWRFYALFVKAYYRNVIIIYFYVNKVYDKVQKSVQNLIFACDSAHVTKEGFYVF